MDELPGAPGTPKSQVYVIAFAVPSAIVEVFVKVTVAVGKQAFGVKVKAGRGIGLIVTDCDVLNRQPLLVTVVSCTVTGPLVLYDVLTGFALLELTDGLPSPKFQMYCAIVPAPAVAAGVKLTV